MIWLSPVKTMESAIVTSISPVRQLLEIRQFISRLALRPLPRLTAALTSGWGTPVLQM